MKNAPDPKAFYDTEMRHKLGDDYATARWGKTPQTIAQYDMNASTIREYVVPLLKNSARILEVGPGPGTWTKLLIASNPSAHYTLVDISKEMLSQARATLQTTAHISFVENDFVDFVNERPFDGFFSSRAFEYMIDKDTAASRIAASLSSGGRGALITKTPKPFFDFLRGRAISDLHSGQIAPRILREILERAGLRVLGIRPATATFPGLNSASLNRLIFRLIKNFPVVFPLYLFTESYCLMFEKL